MYVYAETLKKYDTTTSGSNVVSKNLYWWPIGSVETTTSNGVTFASGEPAPSTILTRFASKGALEIYSEEESINIIAAKGGTVFFATSDSTTIDSEYGYYVVIEHSDGLYTYYGHLAPNSITVKQGDEVAQGQVIGRMGSSGNTASPKLHFEMREGGQLVSNRVNPEEYVDINDPRYYNGEFSLTTTSLSKTEFIALMNRYCITSNNKPFCDNFAAHAEEIYDVSLSSNVNPELVVITAGTEQAWKQTCGFNYWGINIANGEGCSSGGQYASLKEGIQAYAKVINNYLEGGAHSSLIIQRYKERSKAGCDSGGHGLPGTLAGMQSVYSWVGDYRMNPGSAGYGGCYYFQYIYGKDYCDKISTCKGTSYQNRVEECGASAKTTVCEQNDYTIYQLRDKTDFRLKIFGL